MNENLGCVRIAPNVIATIASLTAAAVPGVARMSDGFADDFNRWIGRDPSTSGVKLMLKDSEIFLDLFFSVRHGYSMLEVGQRVQNEVSNSLRQMVGMPVAEVNVFIQAVE